MSVIVHFSFPQAATSQAPTQSQVQQAQMAADLARMQAQIARQVAQDQAQAARDQAQIARDVANATRDAVRQQVQSGTLVVPPYSTRSARRQEGLFFVGFMVVVIAAVAVLRPMMRALATRVAAAPSRDVLESRASAERLERIEMAVEAMAVEIERISEGQRFTTRLLSNRAESEAAPLRRP